MSPSFCWECCPCPGRVSFTTHNLLNPLTTDDTFWRRQFLAACYQLAQSVLKIGSALAERVGQGEVVNAGWAICLLSCTNGCRKRSLHLVGTPFLAAFNPAERSLVGWGGGGGGGDPDSLTILMSGCGQGHEPTEKLLCV